MVSTVVLGREVGAEIDRKKHQSSSVHSSTNSWEKVLPSSLLQILRSRGFSTNQEISRLLSFSLNQLQDPIQILGMDKAALRLFRAHQQKETILIYGDYDMDGSSGLAMMKLALDALGYERVLTYQADRHREGYGFHAHTLDEERFSRVQLIVTVDVGITAFEACSKAKAKNIDVILTDHHLVQDGLLPEAHVVVNPNQPADTSDLKYLCGTGVAFYLLRLLKRHFAQNGVPHAALDLRESLTFVLLATLTDMVPLVGDNRILVKHGLDQILRSSSPAIRSLLKEVLPYKTQLSASDVAIQFAPKLNALTRMECDLKPADFMMIQSPELAKSKSRQILQINSERGEQQKLAEDLAASIEVVEGAPYFFFSAPDIHVGVLGLVATKMCQKLSVPSFVATKNSKGEFVGSARAPEDSRDSLVDILQSCAAGLEKFGGHAKAAGFHYLPEKEALFKEKLSEHFQHSVLGGAQDSVISSAAGFPRLTPSELTYDFIKWIEMFEPFGKNFESFQFHFQDWCAESLVWIKGRHLKLKIHPAEGEHISLTAWFFSADQKTHQLLSSGAAFSFLAEVQKNEFRGKTEIQLILRKILQKGNV